MSKPTSDSQGHAPRTRFPANGLAAASGTGLGAGRIFGSGLTLAISVGVFAFGGLWLDKQFGTQPWLLLVCVAAGITGGMLHCIRVLAPDMWPFDKPAMDARARHRSDRERSPEQNGPPPPG